MFAGLVRLELVWSCCTSSRPSWSSGRGLGRPHPAVWMCMETTDAGGARVLQSHGAWGLAEAAAAHCVTLQAACRESAGRVAGQRLFCVKFLHPGTGAGRSLSACTAAWGLLAPVLKGGCGDTNKVHVCIFYIQYNKVCPHLRDLYNSVKLYFSKIFSAHNE